MDTCVQAESDSGSQNGEEIRSFGVLTVTNSTSIDSYFATKLAKLRNKADGDRSNSKAASQTADDSCSTSDVTSDKYCKQMVQQLCSQTSSDTDRAVDNNTVIVKRHKKKRRKTELEGNDCNTDNEHLCSKSLDSNSNSKKKKKKRQDNDLSEVTAESNIDSQNEKTAETTGTKKKKKRMSVCGQ